MAFILGQHVKYRYPHSKQLVLNDLSFEIKKGEFIGIIGENGAGKSTLCQAFVGLVPQFYKGAYGGKLLVDGMDTAKIPTVTLCQKVGVVFQNPFNQLSGTKDTVYEEVAYGLHNLGICREEMILRVDEALEQLGISQYKECNPFDLSGGQMQRVALASILVMKPEVLVLDEPTSQLDPRGSEEVFAAVELLTQVGITIIMVEHKMEKIAAYCDRVMLLQQGKLIAFDTPTKVFSMESLCQYGIQPPPLTKLCKELMVSHPDGTYPVSIQELPMVRHKLIDRLANTRDVVVEQGEASEKSNIVFEVKDLHFHYGDAHPILQGINVTIDQRTTAIVGQNGAGKTTLVKLLKGLLKPTQGQVLYLGEGLHNRSVASIAKQIGYVFQNPDDQIFKYNVLDEIMFGPLNIGMNQQQAKQQALEALSLVGLDTRKGIEKENPYDLELNQRKMIAIASVLAMDTEVVILDEPTIAQDDVGKEIIQYLIRMLSKQGKVVIAILHDMDLVAACFERVVVMAQGTIIADGAPQEIFAQNDVLEAACLWKPQIVQLCEQLGLGGTYLTVESLMERLEEHSFECT